MNTRHLLSRARRATDPAQAARRRGAGLVVVLATALLAGTASTQRPQFYPDDPISREPESQDASKAQSYQRPDMYEMLYNLFVTSEYKPSGTRARNVNTVDEVPDSSWFTDRIGDVAVTPDQITRGPIVG